MTNIKCCKECGALLDKEGKAITAEVDMMEMEDVIQSLCIILKENTTLPLEKLLGSSLYEQVKKYAYIKN